MRTMRRFKQLLSEADTIEILERGTHGVMAVMADDDYPYAVPLNYYFDSENKKVYFHGAMAGMRYDAMRDTDKVSFCVVDMDENDPENYSTFFRSAIAFGHPRIVEQYSEEYMRAIELLTKKYVKTEVHSDEEITKQIEIEIKTCAITAIDVEFMTGKEAIELVRAKKDSL